MQEFSGNNTQSTPDKNHEMSNEHAMCSVCLTQAMPAILTLSDRVAKLRQKRKQSFKGTCYCVASAK